MSNQTDQSVQQAEQFALAQYVPRICLAAEHIWKNLKDANIHDAMAAAGLLIEFCENDSQLAHSARFASLGVLAASKNHDWFNNVYQLMMQHEQSVKQSIDKFKLQGIQPGDQTGQASILQAIEQFLTQWF